ncbi:MAG: exodeoxyribonuclease III [Candidatus Aenigmatarchaeota archaeon]
MRIATFNVCGWKSAVKKGLLKWIKDSGIDVLAIQELRSEKIIKPLELMNYFCFFNPSKFQGTAIISREEPITITKKLGYKRFDNEGRFIQTEFDKFIFINVYMPHGRRDKKDLPYKLEAYEFLVDHLFKLLEKPVIVVGDFNIAHKEVDLARPKENEESIMFTKEERKKINEIIDLGFIDAFRKFHEKDGYTWWLRRFDAKKRNIGWRIDYVFVTKQLEPYLRNAFVFNSEISDHSPVIVEIDI